MRLRRVTGQTDWPAGFTAATLPRYKRDAQVSKTQETPISGVRARTRAAILTAAMQVLPKHPGTPIHDIADAAGVGRSTVHRYFEDRGALIEALARHVYELSNAGIARADLRSGPPAEAVRRLADEQLGLGRALDFIYNEQIVFRKPALFADLTTADESVSAAIHAALRPGTSYPPGWSVRVFWSLLRMSAEMLEEGVPRHQVLDALMQTLLGGVLAPDPA